jgi:predicted NUDIX family phosphoesterase
MPLLEVNYYKTYIAAVDREVEEEVSVETEHTNKIVALLNDESNEVGSVHMGIVHFWSLDEANVTKKEQMITQMAFMSADELHQAKNSLETWSGICVDNIEKIEERSKNALDAKAFINDL